MAFTWWRLVILSQACSYSKSYSKYTRHLLNFYSAYGTYSINVSVMPSCSRCCTITFMPRKYEEFLSQSTKNLTYLLHLQYNIKYQQAAINHLGQAYLFGITHFAFYKAPSKANVKLFLSITWHRNCSQFFNQFYLTRFKCHET